MKFFRYRRPSLKTLLGVTAAKKRLKKDLGITALLKPLRWWPNQKRKMKREVGYYSEAGRLIRDGAPKPGGCMLMIVAAASVVAIAAQWLLAAENPEHGLARLERSFWLQPSLAPAAQQGSWEPEFPACSSSVKQEIPPGKKSRLLPSS